MSHLRHSYPLIDLSLARRLERTEASANAAFVTARAKLQPGCGATWTEVAGAYAMFDGAGSPLTQTFGLGLFAEAGEADFDALEAFFQQRSAEVHHEISPLAAPALLPHLNGRGYLPIEFTSVMFRPVTGEEIYFNTIVPKGGAMRNTTWRKKWPRAVAAARTRRCCMRWSPPSTACRRACRIPADRAAFVAPFCQSILHGQ